MIAMQTEVLWDLGFIASGYALQVLDWSSVYLCSTDLFIFLATASRLLAEVMLVIQNQALLDTTFPAGVFLVFVFFLFDAVTAVTAALAYYSEIKEKSSEKTHLNIGLGVIGISVLYTAFDIARMVFLLRTEIVTAESLEILQNYKIASNLVLQTGSLISHSLLFLILTKDDISSSIQYKFYFLATAAFLVFAAILQAAIPTMSHSLTSFAWQLDLAVLVHYRFVTKPAEPKELKAIQSGGEKSPNVLLSPPE